MAAGAAISERMKAAGVGLIAEHQGLSALDIAMQRVAPPVYAVTPVQWNSFFSARAGSDFLATFVPQRKSRVAYGNECGVSRISTGVPQEAILEMVRRTTGGSVSADAPLMEAGVDSLGAVELRNQLQSAVGAGVSLPSTLVFDHPTARQLAQLLHPKQSTGVAATWLGRGLVSTELDVGIDGMSALLPLGSSSAWTASFAVRCGCDAIVQVPGARWDTHQQHGMSEQVATRVRHGGFTDGAGQREDLRDPAHGAVLRVLVPVPTHRVLHLVECLRPLGVCKRAGCRAL